MESDAIVEGFRSSVEMHGIKYTKLIGDGDSSVHRKLIDALPYGSSQLVEKIECRNHILRNYCSRLQAVCLNRKVGTVVQRNILRQNMKRLRYSVTSAIRHRKGQQDLPRYRRVEELRQDIVNGPYHVFGQHNQCKNRDYFCDGAAKPGESNLIPSMKETGFFQEIQSAIHRVAANASSLIWDVDNNIAELYNSHVAKAVGGKRVNFALRGSYEARCKAAVISMNSDGTLLRETRDTLGPFSSQFVNRKIHARAARKRRTRGASVKVTSQTFATQAADDDYGPDAACPLPDMSDTELTVAKSHFVQALYSEDSSKVERETRGQCTSVEWKEQRRNRLTASVFGKVCKRRPRTSSSKLVESIRYSTFAGTQGTKWGIEKEPLAIDQFSAEYGIRVESSGLIIDQDKPFLAASPDGLIGEDCLVEVKCPASAKELTPKEGIEQKDQVHAPRGWCR